MTLSIVDFLNARLADDEAAAENASQDPDEGNVWSVGARKREWKQEARIGDDREDLVFDIKDGVCVDFDDLLAYLVRFHPARVLREVAAKRALVESITAETHVVIDSDPYFTCNAATEERDGGESWAREKWGTNCDCGRDDRVKTRLKILAAVYNDHPDYRKEWAA